MKDEEKSGEKKMAVAKKMFKSDVLCEKCGKGHKTKDRDYAGSKFSKKDEKAGRKQEKEAEEDKDVK